MRMRKLLPKVWQMTARLPSDSTVCYLGLLNYCDDQGIAPADPTFLIREGFPSLSKKQIETAIVSLIDYGLLESYKVEGLEYIQISDWGSQGVIDQPSYKFPNREGVIPSSKRRVKGEQVFISPDGDPLIVKENNRQKNQKYSQEDMRLALHIEKKSGEVRKRSARPNLDKWADCIRLMREKDFLTIESIQSVFDWGQTNDFYRVNILSPQKLRESFNDMAQRSGIQIQYSSENNLTLEIGSTGEYSGDVPEAVHYAQLIAKEVLEVSAIKRMPNISKMARELNNFSALTQLPIEYIYRIFLWANVDEFWKSKILSISDLTKKFDKLVATSGIQPDGLGVAPVEEVLTIFEEFFPNVAISSLKGEYDKNFMELWSKAGRMTNRSTGEPYYLSKEEGVQWWARFFNYIKRKTNLPQEDYFNIRWLTKFDNFNKVVSGEKEVKQYYG